MTLPRELEPRTRSVLDPVHGLIRLTDREMQVVDHPLFQRLRHIKQNGLLLYVFPAATHTRFEHSLGVLFVAHGMLNELTLNSRVGVSKGSVKQSEDASLGDAIEFPAAHSPEWNFVYQTTRLAALAHDLGHGPLSHTFDSFSPKRELIKKLLTDRKLAALAPLAEVMLTWGIDSKLPVSHAKNLRAPHELMSCIFFTLIWNDIKGAPDVAQAVCAALLGGEAYAKIENNEARKWIPLVHDIVASAPADADRMDYMERDSRSIGVTYGLFDRERVLKSLLCYVGGSSDAPVYRLGLKHSGLQAIENLMQARYELFVQVYYHKTNRAISRMLDAIAALANTRMNLFGDVSTLSSLSDRYADLSDEQFFRTLLGRRNEVETPQDIRSIAEDIQSRRLWKRVLDPSATDEAEQILEILRTEFADEADWIRKDTSKPKALKDIESGAALLFRDGSGTYRTGRTLRWSVESTVIQGLEEADRKSVRIYYEKVDPKQAKAIRERALALSFKKREATDASA